MDTLLERKKNANELRKSRNFQAALTSYRELWKENGDKFDGTGLLNCLRNLDLFDEALLFADELVVKFPDFKWCRMEVAWTLIQGRLEKLKEGVKIDEVIKEAQPIMKLDPDVLTRKRVVFKVLKAAKHANRWDVVREWVSKLKPEELSKEAIRDEQGREGWCDQSLWYNYYIRCLLEEKKIKEAIEAVDQILETFPKQKKFFLRYKALALWKQGKLKDAEGIYRSLSSRYPDWWILHEYAKVLKDSGNKDESLKLMCRAAISNRGKLETMVSLLEDIGGLLKESGRYEESQAHFLLSRYIRTNQNWTLKDSLQGVLLELKKLLNRNDEPPSLRDALKICKDCWQGVAAVVPVQENNKAVRRGLAGNLSLGSQDRPFCFINMGSESFFCLKSELPSSARDGSTVTFDASPSFDKKKNRESWKAINIKLKQRI